LRRWNGIRLSIALASITALGALTPGVAAAETTFKVTTTADVVDSKGCTVDHCTLREAVSRAGPNDRVDVPAGTYLLERGELFLTSDTIRGDGARSTVIDGGGKSRVLWVTDGTATVSGVTIRGGNGAGRQRSDRILLEIGLLSIRIGGGSFGSAMAEDSGGGIFVESGVLDLVASTVTANAAQTGGGIGASGRVNLIGSTVVRNTAGEGGLAGWGGGIAVDQGGLVAMSNSTVSRNEASSKGGGVYSAGSLLASNATLADNRAEDGGGLFVAALKEGSLSLRNSILGTGAGGACDGPGVDAITSDHNIVGDDSCGLEGAGDRVVDARLLALDNYGGPTNTHGLDPRSPAIDAGVRCEGTDQRGVARPQPVGGRCDAGAFEYRAPTLTVVTRVVNDDGGLAAPGDLGVHVRLGKEDVEGSPRPGSDRGSTYTLDAYQTYTVAADPPPGYDVAVTGDCSPNGNVGLVEGHNRTCTITATDRPATLRVTTQVVNDDGGTLTAGDVRIRVRRGSTEVANGEGTEEATVYSLDAGSYAVSADAMEGYTFTYSGDCAPTLDVGEERSCIVVADDHDPATLRVITNVVNDDGGTRTSGAVITRVSDGTADVASAEGSAAGVDFSLPAGSYVVSADAMEGYTLTYSGDCAPTLDAGETATCTVTADDVPPPPAAINRTEQEDEPPPPPPPPDDQEQPLPPPEPGENVNAEPKRGNVRVKLPGTKRFVLLDDGRQLPVGTVVDARKGHVTLIAAANKKGDTTEAEFWAGIFKIGQTRGKKPITTLTLAEKLSCPKRGKASTAAKRKKKRRLWGSGKGRFRTKGSYSSATVRGTKWLTEDRCTSTLTRVVKGKVSVRDFVKKKTVLVKRGKKYLAKARR
jgi:CSLREA domain-containing protein